MTLVLMLIMMVLIGDCHDDDGDANAGGGDDEWSCLR